MKRFPQIICMFFLVIGHITAQQEKGIVGINNWLNNWAEFNSGSADYGEPTFILAGSITQDITLTKKQIYLLVGDVYVSNNATLSIEPGTIIIGDYKTKASLTISRGAKIIANGEETDPIIFTSNRGVKRAGDWGGIIILGAAPNNKFGNGSVASFFPKLKPSNYGNINYGGDNADCSSGILRFVRIEYAGKRVMGIGNFNGLLLASVGNQTILENIMVSQSAGNSFEVWGGEVNLERAVSYKSNGNDFKFNYGTQSQLNNSLAIRFPFVSNSNGSKCMQIMSYNNKEEIDFTKKGTSVIAKNLTFINKSENLKSDIESGLVNEAIFVGQNASLELTKSVVSGFNPAVVLDEKIKLNQENLDKIKISKMYFNNCNGNIFTKYNPNNDDLENWYGNRAFFNVYSKSEDGETFINIENQKRPDFRLRINKILATNDD